MPEASSAAIAIIGRSVAPMHAAHSARSEQVSQALLGDPAKVLERRGGWRRILSLDGYGGWVRAGALAQRQENWGGDLWEVLPLWANLRYLPDSRTAARLTAYAGSRLPLAERRERWVGLRLPDGAIGWTEEHRARRWPGAAADAPEPTAIVATAQHFLGVPYLWGGCAPLGIDCSGFVQLVWRLNGVPLPRDAHQQAECGADVPLSDIRESDLLFFGEPGGSITHVAICLDGGHMIHAAGGDGVRINSLADGPYGRLVRFARRIGV
jgi:hypothetical protein